MRPDSKFELHTGRSMPVIGLGTWQLTENTDGSVADALEMGYRMIDTSGDYGTQPGVGRAMRDVAVPREEIYLTTKVEEYEDALESTGENLRELGLDHADLMLIHRPPRDSAGEGLWKGLIAARDQGLTADIGVSNYSIEQMRALANATGEIPVVNQIEWSPFGWSQEMLDFCNDEGIVIQAYSPLTRARRLDDPSLTELAADYEATPAQLLLRWNLQHGTAPIPKASQHDHRVENLGALEFEIGPDDMSALDDLNERYSALGSLAYV